MKIKFRQSGGFAGLCKGVDLDTEELSSEEAEQLDALVKESQISSLKAESQGADSAAAGSDDVTAYESYSPVARDVNVYDITIEHGGSQQKVSVDDMTIPQQLHSLVGFLIERAKPVPPE